MTRIMIIKLIWITSLQYGVSPYVSEAVAIQESNLNPNTISKTNDYGLFGLQKQSFPNYTEQQLLDPETNIKLGIKYLAKMKKECKYKNNNEYLVCYNYGIKNTNKVKYPSKWPYVIKVNKIMEGI